MDFAAYLGQKAKDGMDDKSYPEGAEFLNFHWSGNHSLIWLMGVAGKFVSN
jgi:hypothetical protein